MFKITLLQVGESEAIYKLLAHMKLTYSSIATIFVPTEPKGQRRQFLQRQDPESGQGFEIEDKKGRFLEKPDLVSKYERRQLLPRREDEEETPQAKEEEEALEQMSFCQFVKMYEGKGWQEMRKTNEEGETEEPDDDDDEEKPEEGELAAEDGYHYLIVGNSEARRRRLPQLLTLKDVMPGEPRILHKRTFPRAMRFFKKKYDKNPHLFYFTELILYHPFRDENELFPDDPEKCEELYMRHEDEIKYVKAQLMPFLESVEEAQLIYEEMKADERREKEEAMGADLDPEMEQEIADLDDLDEEEHPDYYHLDPGQLDDNPAGEAGPSMVFKAIALPSRDAQVTDPKTCMKMFQCFHFQVEEARHLDARQKEVLSMVLHYAKRCVTFPLASPNEQLSRPSPPLIFVHGGAGTGKSRLINSIYTMMTETFKKAGDDPCCPYVVLTSFTGAASANINGQTLHSLFGFKFGCTFLSMPEKQREEKRLLFRNLRCVIIDEISMVSADMLYNLDLRLREITMVDAVFGGLSVLAFGDLYQLEPVKARYVFKEPTNKEHALAFTLRNLWKLFTVVTLVENHRQGEDKVFGDLLNRVRTGDHTEEDIALLQTRVFPKSALSGGTTISSEQETSIDPQVEHPRTPSPHHYLPDDFLPLQIPISAERPTLQPSFPEDSSCQEDEHPRTPSPRHYLPDDFLPLRNIISSERPTLQPSFPEDSSCQEDEHPRTPSPRHYLPDDFIPLQESISAERPTLQHPPSSEPPHLPKKKIVPTTGISSERETSNKFTIDPDALHIYGTNAQVNARNNAKLDEIGGELYTIKARNASKLVKKFHVNSAGAIRNTPFQAVLKLKVGCDIMLVHNIDTLDGLTNGCRGVLVDVEKTAEGKPKRLVVRFKNPEHGRLRREKNPCHRHPGATYIDPILWRYVLGGATASVFQFPVRCAASMTGHKMQVDY